MSKNPLRTFLRGLAGCSLLACSGAEPGAAAPAGVLPVFEPGPLGPAAPGTLTDPDQNAPAGTKPLQPPPEGEGDTQGEDPASDVSGLTPGSKSGSDTAGDSAEPAPEEPADPGQQNADDGPTPSSGCSAGTPPPVGQLALRVGGADAQYSVTLPPDYRAGVPVPLVFGFHGRNRTHLEFQNVDASQIGSELGSRAVMVYLKSQAGPGWNFAEEVEPNVAFFEALYPVMLSSYCIDTSRVFAVGHSSGGYFSNILACRFGERLRGIAAIAGATQERNCTGRVAALIIHGVRDSVVNFSGGQGSRDFYLAANECSGMTQPSQVSPCVDYQGCAAGLPVTWCQHDEPTYENTNHGWPSFASRAAGQFLFALPRR